jgi:hypothetical protein
MAKASARLRTIPLIPTLVAQRMVAVNPSSARPEKDLAFIAGATIDGRLKT